MFFKVLFMINKSAQITSIRRWIVFFIAALVVSGATAFPIEAELAWVCSWWPEQESRLYHWLLNNYNAIAKTNELYPSLSYGYDWLAFAHIVIAVAFIGVYKDPVRNIWILQFGLIACLLIVPLALIAGVVRGIPWYWQMIDISFGVFGSIPLFICYRKARSLEKAAFAFVG